MQDNDRTIGRVLVLIRVRVREQWFSDFREFLSTKRKLFYLLPSGWNFRLLIGPK